MRLTFAVLIILLFLDAALFNMALATDPHHNHDGQDGIDGIDGIDGLDFSGRQLSDDDLDAHFAGAMAADAINFSFGTRKKQVGFGLGTYNGQNAFAIGIGWLVETEDLEYLVSLKASFVEHSDDVAVGVGATVLIGD